MRTTEDCLRSLARYVAETMGEDWEVRFAEESGTFTRPFAMVWDAGPEAVTVLTPALSEVSAPFEIHLYPEVEAEPMNSKIRAMRAGDRLLRGFTVGVGLGRPMRMPIYDYEEVPMDEAGFERGHSQVGTGGRSVHGDYARVAGLQVGRTADENDERLWTVTCSLRLGWRRSGRLPSSARTVTAVKLEREIS